MFYERGPVWINNLWMSPTGASELQVHVMPQCNGGSYFDTAMHSQTSNVVRQYSPTSPRANTSNPGVSPLLQHK